MKIDGARFAVRLKRGLSARRLWALFLFVVSVLALFAIDLLEEHNPCSAEISCPWYRQVLSSNFWYQIAVTKAGLDMPENRSVALVLMEDPVIVGNTCLTRSFLASLLRTLDNSRITIVFDLWFSANSCSDEDVNSDLLAALQQTHARLVFAQPTLSARDLLSAEPEALSKRKFDEGDLVLKDTLFSVDPRFIDLVGRDNENKTGIPRITTGLTKLNEDNRRIPLMWYAFPDRGSIGRRAKVLTDTLAVAAVRAYNKNDPFLSKLPDFEASGKDPYTSFLRQDQFLQEPAEELLCKGPYRDKIKGWRCPAASESPGVPADLNNRLIVVGKLDLEQDSDVHDTVVGRMPGVVLQANYIEALLSRRWFRRVPGFIELILAVVWFGIIDFIFKKYAAHPLRALLISAGASLVTWIFIYHFVVSEFGYYISMLVPSFLMILARFIWTIDLREDKHPSDSRAA